LQAFEFEVFEVGVVALIEYSAGVGGRHVVVPSRKVQNHPTGIDGVSVQVNSCQQSEQINVGKLLRVAASSNQCLELTALEHRGSARKGREESALSGLGKRLLAAVQVGRYTDFEAP
jgi:hypothetical protein